MFKAGDKVKLKSGVNTSTWGKDFVKYIKSTPYIIVAKQHTGNTYFYIQNWGNIDCEHFELYSRRKEKLKLPEWF